MTDTGHAIYQATFLAVDLNTTQTFQFLFADHPVTESWDGPFEWSSHRVFEWNRLVSVQLGVGIEYATPTDATVEWTATYNSYDGPGTDPTPHTDVNTVGTIPAGIGTLVGGAGIVFDQTPDHLPVPADTINAAMFDLIYNWRFTMPPWGAPGATGTIRYGLAVTFETPDPPDGGATWELGKLAMNLPLP